MFTVKSYEGDRSTTADDFDSALTKAREFAAEDERPAVILTFGKRWVVPVVGAPLDFAA